MLYAGFFIMGLSQGLVEPMINPLIATCETAGPIDGGLIPVY